MSSLLLKKDRRPRQLPLLLQQAHSAGKRKDVHQSNPYMGAQGEFWNILENELIDI